MGFSRQEYWSRLPFPSLGDLPNLGIEPRSLALQVDYLPSEPWGKALILSIVFFRQPTLFFKSDCKGTACVVTQDFCPYFLQYGLTWEAAVTLLHRWLLTQVQGCCMLLLCLQADFNIIFQFLIEGSHPLRRALVPKVSERPPVMYTDWLPLLYLLPPLPHRTCTHLRHPSTIQKHCSLHLH